MACHSKFQTVALTDIRSTGVQDKGSLGGKDALILLEDNGMPRHRGDHVVDLVKSSRNLVDAMAATMQKLLQQLTAEANSSGTDRLPVQQQPDAAQELVLVQARTRELELQIELRKLQNAKNNAQ